MIHLSYERDLKNKYYSTKNILLLQCDHVYIDSMLGQSRATVCDDVPALTQHRINVLSSKHDKFNNIGLMFGQRRRQWTNIKTTLICKPTLNNIDSMCRASWWCAVDKK